MPKNEGLAGVVLEEIFKHLIEVQDPGLEEACGGDKDLGIKWIKETGLVKEDTDYSFEIEYGSITGKGYDTHILPKEDHERKIREMPVKSLISSGPRGSYSWFLMEKPEFQPAS